MGVETAVAVIAGSMVAGTAASMKAGHDARKQQKKQQAYQNQIIAEQNKQALENRKGQINQMREQIAGGNYSTRATSEKGIIGSIVENGNTLG